MQFGVQFFPAVSPTQKPANVYFSECLAVAEEAERNGFKAAVALRDGGRPIAEGWSQEFRATFGPYRP